MTVGICGLGLIGGSMAKAYKAAGHTVLGYDKDSASLGYASLAGIIDGTLDDGTIPECDLIFIALYPMAAIEYLMQGGRDAGKADAAARDLINEVGYAGKFGHSLGHSLGIYIHESPRLSSRSLGNNLVVGNVFSVEPGIYLEGKYGVRIEDVLAIRESGVVNFTHSPKELIII